MCFIMLKFCGNIILWCFLRYASVPDTSSSEEASRGDQQQQQVGSSLASPGPAEESGTTVISVPGGSLKNIRHNRETYESYLCTAAHEAVGSISPWAVAGR